MATTVDLRGELPRADWSIGTNPTKTSVTVHWNGTPVPDGVSDLDVIFGDANYHISEDWSPEPGIQGGDGIMYHRLYGRDGTVYLTRDPADILWHCGDATGNATSEAWQVMCGTGQHPTAAQLVALARDLLADGRTRYPHRHWSATQCPGDELAAWVQGDLAASLDYSVLGTETVALPSEPQFPPMLVELYSTLAPLAGIRPAIAFAQMLHETNHWKFTGDVPASYNNPAGLGAFGGAGVGAQFDTLEHGVRGHLGHLLAYFGDHNPEFCDFDPRHDAVGHAHYANDIRLLDGHWAVPGDGYGEAIAALASTFPTEEDLNRTEVIALLAEFGIDQMKLPAVSNILANHEYRLNAIEHGTPAAPAAPPPSTPTPPPAPAPTPSVGTWFTGADAQGNPIEFNPATGETRPK